MHWTLHTFLLMISFNFLLCLLGWPESLLISSLSLLCHACCCFATRCLLEKHHFLLHPSPLQSQFPWLGTGLIICAYFQDHSSWSFHCAWFSAPSCFSTSTLAQSFFLRPYHITAHVLLSPQLEPNTEHTHSYTPGCGIDPNLQTTRISVCVINVLSLKRKFLVLLIEKGLITKRNMLLCYILVDFTYHLSLIIS